MQKQLYDMTKKKSTKPVIGTGSDDFEDSFIMAEESICFGHESNFKTFRSDFPNPDHRRKAMLSKPKSQLEEPMEEQKQ